MLSFEIIGEENGKYFLMGYDSEVDMSKGIFFFKASINFFDCIDKDQPYFDVLMEIEDFVERNSDLMICDGFLELISADEFMNVEVSY